MINNYLQSQANRIVISQCVKHPILFKTLKPWWFEDKIACGLAWSAFKHAKSNSNDPDRHQLLNIYDYEKSDTTQLEVIQYLDAPTPDRETIKNLFSWFKSRAMLLEPIYEHYNKRPLDSIEHSEWSQLAERFKTDLTNELHNEIKNKYQQWRDIKR
jgi:hypothetical protein